MKDKLNKIQVLVVLLVVVVVLLVVVVVVVMAQGRTGGLGGWLVEGQMS